MPEPCDFDEYDEQRMYAYGSLSLVELMQTYISDLVVNNNNKN